MADEEEKKEAHKPEEHAGKGGIAGSFQKHKTLWIVGGVGAAGVLLLLFMNSGGGSSTSSNASPSTDTSGLNTQGAGGAVDTSSLVGSGGYPSWYNPGAAENLDYWPYVPVSDTSNGSKSGSSGSKSGGSSGSKSGSKSGSSGSKSGGSKSGGSKSGGSKGTSGGVTHGTGSSHHGVSKGTKTSTNKNKVSSGSKGPLNKLPQGKAAHAHTVSVKAGQNWGVLQSKYFPGSSGTAKQGNIVDYNGNLKKGGFVYKNGSYYTTGKKISV